MAHPSISSSTPPRLVLFDLDDTLCDHDRSLRMRLRIAFTAAFDGTRPENINEIVEQSVEISVGGTEHFPEVLGRHGISRREALEQAKRAYVQDRYYGLELFEEAVEVVNIVREQTRIGMITNGPSDIQRNKIERLGIGPLFPFILVSEEVGIWKPDREIFEYAMELGEASPEETVYIGDNPDHDIAGAHNAGIGGVWVNRARRRWPGGTPAHAEIQDLRELIPLLFGSADTQ